MGDVAHAAPTAVDFAASVARLLAVAAAVEHSMRTFVLGGISCGMLTRWPKCVFKGVSLGCKGIGGGFTGANIVDLSGLEFNTLSLSRTLNKSSSHGNRGTTSQDLFEVVQGSIDEDLRHAGATTVADGKESKRSLRSFSSMTDPTTNGNFLANKALSLVLTTKQVFEENPAGTCVGGVLVLRSAIGHHKRTPM